MSDRSAVFCHEALFYGGDEEFLAGTLPFINEATATGEPILIAVSDAKISLLEANLNGRPGTVRFEDITQIGRNPARILPLWHQFVGDHAIAGRPVRGIGEPVLTGRSPAELIECEHNESLLNLAFADAPEWRLMCPYDTEAVDAAVIEAAERSHPFIVDDGLVRPNDAYLAPDQGPGPLDDPLPEPSQEPEEMSFALDSLNELRSFAYEQARSADLDAERAANLVLAISEVATNSVRHGGGRGTARVWREADALVCDVTDSGRIESPLVGRSRPAPTEVEGRGLWLVNELCDLVQIRSSASGSVVRLHIRRA
jgi:anti-sigma regulatory factor (Ser/Thr protein kinase)